MKTSMYAIFCSICLTFIVSTVFAEMPGPDGKALWQYISKESPYTGWAFWDDHQGLQEGDAPHAPQHKVFVNKTGTAPGKTAAEFGTIVVKENIGNDNKLKALTVMYKVEGFNPEKGDWFWAKYSPKGKVAKSGKVKGCIGCHNSVEDNDYIYVHEFE